MTSVSMEFAGPAEMFLAAGAHHVVPDFAWVQDVGGNLMVLADQVCRAVAWVHRNAARFGGDPNRLYVAGQSPGGHLAAVALTTDWKRQFTLPADVIKGGMCISGIYDLELPRRVDLEEFWYRWEFKLPPFCPTRHQWEPASGYRARSGAPNGSILFKSSDLVPYHPGPAPISDCELQQVELNVIAHVLRVECRERRAKPAELVNSITRDPSVGRRERPSEPDRTGPGKSFPSTPVAGWAVSPLVSVGRKEGGSGEVYDRIARRLPQY